MEESEVSSLYLAAPFGAHAESASSSRYFWSNDQRGKESFVIIQYTTAGEGRFRWQGKTWQVPREHAFIAIVPEASEYYYPAENTTPWMFQWLNLYGELAVSVAKDFRAVYGPVLHLLPQSTPASIFSSLALQAEKRINRDPCDVSTACFTFFMEWKRLLDRPGHRNLDPVGMARQICRTRFREPLGIKELAAQTGMSREHFTRLFVQKEGVSPARFLRDLRLEAAQEVLAAQGTLKEAALRCGFPSTKALKRLL